MDTGSLCIHFVYPFSHDFFLLSYFLFTFISNNIITIFVVAIIILFKVLYYIYFISYLHLFDNNAEYRK